MYFSQFESYEQAIGATKTFHIEVTYVNGSSDASSTMPIMVLPTVIEDIAQCEEAKVAFHLWKHTSRTITVIPYHSIKSIQIVLL